MEEKLVQIHLGFRLQIISLRRENSVTIPKIYNFVLVKLSQGKVVSKCVYMAKLTFLPLSRISVIGDCTTLLVCGLILLLHGSGKFLTDFSLG